MKKISLVSIIALSLTIIFSTGVFATQPQITVVVNDSTLVFPDAQPFVDAKGRTQTPAKYIGEALGATVSWNSRAKKAEFYFGDTELVIYIGKSSYQLNGQTKQMDTTAIIKDGRTYVPAKYIAEAFGAKVKWDGVTKTIYVDRTLASQVEEGKDVEDGTVINNNTEFLEALRLASITLQPTINLKCSNFDDSDYIFEDFNQLDITPYGATKVNARWLEYSNMAELTMDIVYSQVHKIQKSMVNDIASTRLSSEDFLVIEKIEEIVSEIISDDMTDYEKELAIHDYIVSNYKYDYDNYLYDTIPDESYTPYGLLINGTGVCQAYAEVTKLLLNRVGIECDVVTGTSRDENHAWNILKLDDEYYMLDVTWNDPTPDEEGYVSYDYFNMTQEQFLRDHSWDTSKWPVASGTKYNYFVYNDLVVHNYMEFQNLVKKSLSEGKKDIVMYIYGYDKGIYNLDFIFNYCAKNQISYTNTNEKNTVFRILLE
ncbi:hypothetical protein EHE19_002655 [Ruminiclostridium herbifermentans]|uniref:Transglutaminase-like domain-containing protein n=1 Tax=Ruminiclostridium herbifermentans TaxID=2488810 RepID=A0A4U7JHC2_9FIRM|nr:stalk domain-containing protein [Ruminiclostridium herbifermentans]QNU67449.1 hypothetical protein EHE19_002655 [Ruminiclostridium herbifermentans]